jgi:hypothetical protein
VLLWLTDNVLGSFEIKSTSNLLMSAGAITFVNGIFQFALMNAHRVQPLYAGPKRWI